jgi:hypothetical protein
VARAEALFSRDAISPVNCATTLLTNSSAIGASVQDATMHALFAAVVEWKVRLFWKIIPVASFQRIDAGHLRPLRLLGIETGILD